jgi:hypothetical protein
MRIRTDGDKAYRKDEIEKAAAFYDRNKTDSVVRACADVPQLVENIEAALEREDLTLEQRRELAATLSTRNIEFTWSVGQDGIVVESKIED